MVAASLGMAVTAVSEAIAAVSGMEVRPLEVHWRGGQMQTAGVAALQDAVEAAEEEEVPAAVAGATCSRGSSGMTPA